MAMAEYPSYPLPTSEGFSHQQAGRAACYRQLMDIIYFHLALRVEESFSTRVLQTLCSLRIYIILGLAPWRIYNGNSNAFGCLFYSFTSTLGTISGLTESAASLISNHLCNRDFIFHSKFRWLIGRLFFLSCTIAQQASLPARRARTWQLDGDLISNIQVLAIWKLFHVFL